MVPIKQALANRTNYGAFRDINKIKYIVIHYTGNDGDSDESNARYFRNNIVKASAHYFVDDNSITQSVPDNFVAYAVGGKKYNNFGGRLYGTVNNSNSISVELCDAVKDKVVYPSQKTINNAIELVQTLMKKYNVPAYRVIRHWDVNGKNCVPLNTEVLTKNGWKNITEMKIGDEIITAHIDNMKLEYSPILNIIEPYKTRVYSMNGITLTANHRVVFQTSEGRMFKIDSWQEIMKKKQSTIPICGQLNASGIDISENALKLLVAIQADGYYEKDNTLQFHFSKERKVERLEKLLSDLGIVYRKGEKSDGTISIRIYDNDNEWFYRNYFEDRNLLNNKVFTYELLKLSKQQVDIFINELFYWDGSFTNKDEYFSMIKQNCDVVSAIACCNNIKVSERKDDRDLWWVYFRNDNLTVGSTTEKTIKRDQKVTCVTVSSGLFLVKQEGRIFITGNCPSYWTNDSKWKSEFWNKLGNIVQPSGQDKNPYKEPTKQVTSKANAQKLGISVFEFEGESVKWLQWELSKVAPAYNDFLNLHGGIDGKCGNNTVELLKLFQRNYGLVDDGVCGKNTRAALKAN